MRLKRLSHPSLIPTLVLVCALLTSSNLFARPLTVADDEWVSAELVSLLLSPQGTPVVLLQPHQSQQVVPIFIGLVEGQAIENALQDVVTPRPMTHDLLRNLVLGLDLQLKRVLIDQMQQGAYLSFLELDGPTLSQPRLIDARPSDAMALALRVGAEIYLGPSVLDSATEVDVRLIAEQLVTARGISVSHLPADLRQALDLPDTPGVLVTEALGSAQEQGLMPGALITHVNEQSTPSPMAYLRAIRQAPPQATLRLQIWQAGETQVLQVTTDHPVSRPRPPAQPPAAEDI